MAEHSAPEIKKRRRILYGAALLALALIAAFAVITLTGGEDKEPTAAPELERPVIVERIALRATKGEKGRGIAELIKRADTERLRVLAVDLERSREGQVYQLLLAGGKPEPKLLGNVVVGEDKTFVGEAAVTGEELHSYRRIEIRRVTEANPPIDELVLRGAIPR
jgi:hypothetical protein